MNILNLLSGFIEVFPSLVFVEKELIICTVSQISFLERHCEVTSKNFFEVVLAINSAVL